MAGGIIQKKKNDSSLEVQCHPHGSEVTPEPSGTSWPCLLLIYKLWRAMIWPETHYDQLILKSAKPTELNVSTFLLILQDS